jgi:transcriptional regulator with XRE-family HTH domain
VSDNTTTNRELLAKKLKAARAKCKLSLRQVEAFTGVSNAIVSQMENGKIVSCSYDKLSKLCRLYNIDMNTLYEVPNENI